MFTAPGRGSQSRIVNRYITSDRRDLCGDFAWILEFWARGNIREGELFAVPKASFIEFRPDP